MRWKGNVSYAFVANRKITPVYGEAIKTSFNRHKVDQTQNNKDL